MMDAMTRNAEITGVMEWAIDPRYAVDSQPALSRCLDNGSCA